MAAGYRQPLGNRSRPRQGAWQLTFTAPATHPRPRYFNYHAVPTNTESLAALKHHVTVLWRRALRRRSQKDRTTWERMTRLAADYLPVARVLHPWPDARSDVKYPR